MVHAEVSRCYRQHQGAGKLWLPILPLTRISGSGAHRSALRHGATVSAWTTPLPRPHVLQPSEDFYHARKAFTRLSTVPTT